MSQAVLNVEDYREGVGCVGRCDCGVRCSGNRTAPGHLHACANCHWASLPHDERHRYLEAMGYLDRCTCGGPP